VSIEVVELPDSGVPPRNALRLPRPLLDERKRDVSGWNRDGGNRRPRRQKHVAGVVRKQPVGSCLADGVVFDAVGGAAPVAELAVLRAVEVVNLKNLQLQRDGQAVLKPATTATNHAAPSLQHLAGSQRHDAVE